MKFKIINYKQHFLFICLLSLNVNNVFSKDKNYTHQIINHDSLDFLCRYEPSVGFTKAKNLFYYFDSNKNTYKKAEALYFLGKSIGNLHKYEEALKYLYHAKRLLNKFKSDELSLYIDLEIAKQHGKLNLYDKAIALIDECILNSSIIKNSDSKNYFLADLYSNRAFFIGNIKPVPTISYLLSHHLKASYYIEKCIKKKYNYAYSNIGLMYFKLNKYEIAINYYNKAIREAKQFKVKNIGIIYLNMGDLYFKKNNFLLAIKYADSSLMFSKKKYYLIKENYRLLNQSYLKLNKISTATNYEKLALIYSDSLLLRDNKEIIKGTNFLLNKIEYEKEEIHTKSIILQIVIVLGIVVSIFVIIILIKKYSKNIKYKEIRLNKKASEIITLKQKVKDSYEDIIQLAKSDDPLFTSFFKELYPEFYIKLMQVQPKLTLAEQKVCFYIKLKFTTKEIATYTFVSIKAIQNRKNRLRKRLGLKNAEDIYEWIDNL